MRKELRKMLSVTLAAAMLLAHVQPGYAAGDGREADSAASQTEESRVLETEPMDPAKLGIKKLGEETADGAEDTDTDLSGLTPDLSLEKTVRVSIFLEGGSTIDVGFDTKGIAENKSALAYRDTLKRQQADLTAKIESVLGHTLDVKWNLTLLTNAISANVKVKEIPLIERLAGVRKVELEKHYDAPVTEDAAQPQTANTSENMVGAVNAWYQLGYTGAGTRIAIIDTGLDTNHQSVDADAFNYAIEEVRADGKTVELMTQVTAAVANQLNSKSSNYISDKIPYGYNYVDNSTRVNHQDSGSNHGSHVAGIAAANRYIKQGSSYVDAAETVGAVGMAPDAQILVMKVFSSSGASDSDYFAALEDAIVLGADAANLSLGSSSPGWTYDTEYQTVLNSFVNNKTNNHMVISISAGNSYAADDFVPSGHLYAEDVSFHTGGSPGSFINSLGVAAAQNTLTTGTPLMFNGSQQVFYTESTEDGEGTTYSNPAMTTIAGTYSYVYIDAVGAASDYSTVNSAVSLSGKIVIVNRGSLNFAEKGNNAKSYSPKAVIIANNAEGTIRMDLSEFTGTFPMVSILLKDAQQIKENSTVNTAGGITYYTGSVQVTTTEVSTVAARVDAEITDFSSWGVPGSLIMKPEITAPGGDIYSINGTSSASSDSNTGTDKYVSYSGTSMAAPHIAGLAAVLMQYLKEKTPANTELMSAYNLRAVAQSLLMSTATPMINSNAYLSILQQGAGLAEVSKAIEAKSVIMMDEAGLTTLTRANTDGKVKVELGDDPDRKGEYDFSFTIYNISDKTLTFELDTDLFTQRIDNGDTLSHKTVLLPEGGVTYAWNGTEQTDPGHDVDKDGDTDNDDAQAILDFLSGVKAEEEVDLTVADMDGDKAVTSRDAYLLIDWTAEAPEEGYTIAAGEKAQVSVHIKLTDAQKAVLDDALRRGAYLEGFTYVTCVTDDAEGVSYAHEHSIPILGYYGSWTDPEMFDTNSYTENLYGNEQQPYSGANAAATNYMRITTNGTLAKFSGNPYIVETDENGKPAFPEENLAIRSDAKINNIAYNLIRPAAGTGFAVSKLNEDGSVARIVYKTVTGQEVSGAWYHTNNATWQETTTKQYSFNHALNEYNGLAEGDRVRVGFYAIPEYNTMLESDDLTATEAGLLTDTMFESILTSNVLGKGAFVGFDFTIDDTAPEVTNATLTGDTLSITASDNQALAYVAVVSLDGTVQYAEAAPGTGTYTVTFDASDAIANAQGYVAAFAGDYAGNEAAVAVKVNDNTHVEKTVYVLTDTLEAGHDYLIVSRNTAGTGYGLYYTLNTAQTTATAGAFAATVKAGTADTDNKPYIESSDAASTGIWTSGSGSTNGTYFFGNNGWYLRRSNQNALTITKDTSRRDWTWNGTYNRLSINSRYLRYYNNTFSLNTATNSVYLYVKTTITYEVDPYSVMSVTVTPNTLELYRGGTAALTAKVAPLTANPRTVTWTSSNNNVATVNENGLVTAVAKGTATIRATSTADSTKYGECVVTVEAINKELSAAIWDEAGDVYFSYFNANNLPNWTKRHTTPVGQYLTSAFMADASNLYASTNDLQSSVIYSVNRTGYGINEYGENYVPAFGMAPVGSSFGTGYYVYAFANYLIFGNLAPETDDELGTYSGFPYGLLDLTKTSVGDAYAVAVCVRNRSTTSAGYYFLDENGKIWQTTQSYDQTNGITFGTPTLVYDTGITAGLTYNSIYYDGTNLYWSHQEGEYAKLYILANANTAASRKFYDAGNFGDGVWPAAGLYVNGSVAPASAGGENEIMTAGEGTIDLSSLKLQISRDELFTADIQARFAAEAENLKAGQAAAENAAAEAAAEEAEPAETAVDAVTEPVPAETPAEEAVTEAPAEEANEASADGSAVTDQTEELEASSEDKPEAEAPAEESAGEEPSEEELPAEDSTVEEPAEETEEASDEASADEETVMAELPPEMTGGLNLALVTLRKEFITDAAELNAVAVETSEDKPGTVTVKITEESAVNNGLYSIAYDPEFMTVKTTESPAAYQSFGNDTEKGILTFAFADKTAVEAGSVIAVITFTVTSCEDIEDGLEVITLERNETVDLSESQPFDVTGIGHAWGEPVWSWEGADPTYTSATATFTCEHNAEHTLALTDSELGYEVTAEPTVSSEGRAVYTASVTLNGVDYSETREVTLAILPAEGYHINVDLTYMKGTASTSVSAEQLYSGEVTFTVSEAEDLPCLVLLVNTDGSYEKLTCTTANGIHSYTITVTRDVDLIVVHKGDVNLDGRVSSKDANSVSKFVVETIELTALQQLIADTNESGGVTSKDANLISKVVVETASFSW